MDHNVGAVIVDFDVNINYAKLTKASIHLRKPDCLFLAGACDMKVPLSSGFKIIGPGCFVSALEQVSGRKPMIFGKPSPLIRDCIMKKYPIDCGRTLMIGDMLESDIKLGTNCGFLKLLVLSGISKLEDTKEDNTNVPHYYIKTLGDLFPLLPTS
ncbi:hypothetical protein L9F63_027723 [Diploptera punctata]|nr:hypothetical protein L9F63_027723 [Diploptera punctata]